MDVRKKLINANDLLNSIRDDYNINGAHFSRIRLHIEDAPAVEVVRCWECKYHKDTSVTEYKHCCLIGQTVRYDDFCSFGERKDGDD